MSKPLVLGSIAAVVGLFALGGFLLWQQTGQDGLGPSSPVPATPASEPSTAPSPTSDEETKVAIGKEDIKVLPGDSIVLADGETRIRFSNSGYAEAVPDVVFGEHYLLNDIHNINYLAIRRTVSFYRNDYFFELENKGCNTETRFTDVPEIWVTDCLIHVSSEQIQPLELEIHRVSQEINANTSFNEAVSIKPFIRVIVPKVSLWRFSDRECCSAQVGSATSYNPDQMWDIRFITAFGIDTIRYTPKEIGERSMKELSIGPLQVQSSIADYKCRVIYSNENLQTEQCDDITMDLLFTGVDDKPYQVQIQNYTDSKAP